MPDEEIHPFNSAIQQFTTVITGTSLRETRNIRPDSLSDDRIQELCKDNITAITAYAIALEKQEEIAFEDALNKAKDSFIKIYNRIVGGYLAKYNNEQGNQKS